MSCASEQCEGILTAESCPECGAVVTEGREGCQALYDAFAFQAMADFRVAAVHALAFDTYCMQHVETYCVSAKSYAAHLTRLCVGVEYGGDPALYAALQRWYHAGLVKPAILYERGQITIAEIQAIADVPAKVTRIREWAEHVWDVYNSQHALARQWVEAALSTKGRR
ncbi:MAG: hypothetical protein H6671_09175 [Anaerolineaceae bacterium]|nr:hypothetical protein [Anaerolineaceae bacterium]